MLRGNAAAGCPIADQNALPAHDTTDAKFSSACSSCSFSVSLGFTMWSVSRKNLSMSGDGGGDIDDAASGDNDAASPSKCPSPSNPCNASTPKDALSTLPGLWSVGNLVCGLASPSALKIAVGGTSAVTGYSCSSFGGGHNSARLAAISRSYSASTSLNSSTPALGSCQSPLLTSTAANVIFPKSPSPLFELVALDEGWAVLAAPVCLL
mmetsp:Transcript_23748/g.60005  ORF Transcript_23748/g.60005 Transcript_23748/m.60005 type:complete len:209 (-) Transcript_23748:366-992(-)